MGLGKKNSRFRGFGGTDSHEQQQNNPGCVWNLFHVFHFQNRHPNMKKLLHWNHHNHAGQGIKGTSSNEATDNQETYPDYNYDSQGFKLGETNNNLGHAKSRKHRNRSTEELTTREISKDEDSKRRVNTFTIPLLHFSSFDDSEEERNSLLAEVGNTFDTSAFETFEGHFPDAAEAPTSCNSHEKTLEAPRQKMDFHSWETSYSPMRKEPSQQAQLDEFEKRLLEKHALLQEKLDRAKEAILNQNFKDAKELTKDMILHQSKEFLDTLEIYNSTELFRKLTRNKSSRRDYQIEDPQSLEATHESNSEAPCTSSSPVREGSSFFSGESSSEAKFCNSPRDEYRIHRTYDSPSRIVVLKPVHGTSEGEQLAPECTTSSPQPPLGLSNQEEGGSINIKLKDLQRRLKRAMRESRKEKHRISMDAILHRVPYGQKDDNSDKMEGETTEEPRLSHESIGSTSGFENESEEIYSSALGSPAKSYQSPESDYNRKANWVPPERPKQNIEERKFRPPLGPKGLKRVQSWPRVKMQDPFDMLINMLPETTEPRTRKEDSMENNTTTGSTEGNERETSINSRAREGTRELEDIPSKPIKAKVTQQSPESVLDSYFEDDTSSPTTFLSMEVPTLKQGINTDKQDHIAEQQVQSSEQLAHSEYRKQHTQVTDMVPDHPTYNQQYEEENADFAFVRNVLNASVLRADDYSKIRELREPVDPSLFSEVEGLPSVLGDETISSNHQLLFDCINEVLLEMYDRSLEHNPWFASLKPSMRPTPTGSHILEEVWSSISWHLSSQSQLASIDNLVARDLAKDNSWMNLQLEAECVGVDLMEEIIDDLLDETLFEVTSYS